MRSSAIEDVQRRVLVTTTAVAVVCDALLIPFYPQVFSRSFGVKDPAHVGLYLACTCATVMLALPLWARLERYASTLWLLCAGQLGAGLASLWCAQSTSLVGFWCASLVMVACKGSYLLVYPYLMRFEQPSHHETTVGLLTALVHLGGVAGASFGGWILERLAPQQAFTFMAAGDFLQMMACVGLIAMGAQAPVHEKEPQHSMTPEVRQAAWRSLVPLGVVMLLFYFSVFVLRPFFVEYWTRHVWATDDVVAGLVFSIPAWMSLVCLGWRRLRPLQLVRMPGLIAALAIGVGLQAVGSGPVVVLLGRCVFGWCVFRAMVHLDVKLFEASNKADYAQSFSWMNVCQQLGVLLAFWMAGTGVAFGGLRVPFGMGLVGLSLTALVYHWFFVRERVVRPIATVAS